MPTASIKLLGEERFYHWITGEAIAMKTTCRSHLICVPLFLAMFFLSVPSTDAQKNGFKNYTFYHSEVQTNRLDLLPTIQVQKYEVKPPFTTDCQSIDISPDNGCRVEISSLVNSGIAQISEVTSPGNLESTVIGIQGLVVFNPHTGTINLLANTPGAEAGELQVAHAALEFTYDFAASPKTRIVSLRDFSAATIGQIAGGGADISIHLSNPSTGVFWQVIKHLEFTANETVPDQKIDLFNFVGKGDTVTLTVSVYLLAYSVQEGPLPAESAVSFRLTIPKQ
jgi:hypothetical protein